MVCLFRIAILWTLMIAGSSAHAALSCSSGQIASMGTVLSAGESLNAGSGGVANPAVGTYMSKGDALAWLNAANGALCYDGSSVVGDGWQHHWVVTTARDDDELFQVTARCQQDSGNYRRDSSLVADGGKGLRSITLQGSCIDPEPSCSANAGDLQDLVDSVPAGATTACASHCVVTPFAGMQISTSSSSTGAIMYGIVKEPPTWCEEGNVPSEEFENGNHRCKVVDGVKTCAQRKLGYVEESPGDSSAVPPVLQSEVSLDEVQGQGCAKYSGSNSALCTESTDKAPQEPTGSKIQPDAVIAVSPYSHQGGYACGTGTLAGQCIPGQLGGNYQYFNETTINNYGCSNVDGTYTCTQGPGCGPGTIVKDGQCVGSPNCGPGTHEQNGMCVADGDGDSDGGDCDPTQEDCDDGGGGECPAGAECGFVAPKSGGGFADARSGVQAAQAELQAEFTKIRQEIKDMGGRISTGDGALPCTSFSMLGSTVPFCLSEYQSALSIIAKALMAVVVFISAMIIFKAD